MKNAALGLVAALSLLASSATVAVAGEGHSHGPGADHQHGAATAKLKEVSVEELAKLLADGKATPIDANGAETRQKFGTIPGARLLTSSSQYDTSAELPTDKSGLLVFYCANTRCTASDKAAERAHAAGFKNVAVLRVGIAGWADKGQKTTPQG